MGIREELDSARALLVSGKASATANANEAFRRAVIALEQRLEDLVRERGGAPGDFNGNLLYLRGDGTLPEAHYGRLNRIRELRNCAYHNELDVPPLRAASVLSEIEAFVRATSPDLAGLMTRGVRTVEASAPLAAPAYPTAPRTSLDLGGPPGLPVPPVGRTFLSGRQTCYNE